MTVRSQIERRSACELRAVGRTLEGYAAVFGQPARISNFNEIVLPGAFRNSLRANTDILALVDHDPTKVLARTKAGTLELAEDGKGLRFSLTVPRTTAGDDALELVRTGNAGGMSFAFKAVEERWQRQDQRELLRVELHEISVVSAWPAYDGTSVQARARSVDPARLHLARLYLDTVQP